jgi:hypothetical protein
MRKTKVIFRATLGMAMLMPFTAGGVEAASIWTGNGGAGNRNFGTAGNWSLAPTFNSSATLQFGTGLGGTFNNGNPLLDADRTVGNIQISNGGSSVTIEASTDPGPNLPYILTVAAAPGGGTIEVFDNATHVIKARVQLGVNNATFLPGSSGLTHGGVKLDGGLIGGTNNLVTSTSNMFLIDLSDAPQASGSGTTTVSGSGTNSNTRLRLSNTNQIFSGNLIMNKGTIEWEGATDFTMGVGTGSGQINLSTGAFFAALGADRNVNFGGSSATVTLPSFSTYLLGFGSIDADHTMTLQNPVTVANVMTIWSVNGTAAVEGKLTGAIAMGTNKPLTFRGNGAIELGAANTISAGTTLATANVIVGGGTLRVDTASAFGATGTGLVSLNHLSGENNNAAVLTNAAITITNPFQSSTLGTGRQLDGRITRLARRAYAVAGAQSVEPTLQRRRARGLPQLDEDLV